MTFKWKNKDEELPMSIERADQENTSHPFQWGTLWFGVSLGMVIFLGLSVLITMTFPTFP